MLALDSRLHFALLPVCFVALRGVNCKAGSKPILAQVDVRMCHEILELLFYSCRRLARNAGHIGRKRLSRVTVARSPFVRRGQRCYNGGMPATTSAFRIDAHTWLIDAGLYGLAGAAAVYLVQGRERSCLIDAGPHVDAAARPGPIVRALQRLRLFPPDLVVLTHAHHDHAQGVPALRRAAAREDRQIEVLASWRAIHLLEDAGHNRLLNTGELEGISGVTPLREGQRLDLGGVVLRVCEVPGHCAEHVALLDETNGNLFAGDAIGLRLGEGCTLPPFMPPSWD
ncbi:MAG: MBL fold metallo-hydrolase, partial [Chloroflexi bacterium]